MLEKGWTKYDDYNQKDKILPALQKGDVVNVRFEPVEKETTPPKHYTIETLNNYLKNPFKEEKSAAKETEGEIGEDDAADYKAIFEGLELGTEATRTGIIDNARKSRYIELKKDVYSILPDGEFLVESLVQMQISMDKYKTSELGQALKKVFHGKMTVEECVRSAEEQIAAVFDKRTDDPIRSADDTGFMGDEIGVCPLCGGTIVRHSSFYGCDQYQEKGCKFSLNTVICGRAIPIAQVKKLLTEGQTDVMDGFISQKSGKKFSAAFKLENGKAVFVFPPRPVARPIPYVTVADGEQPPPLEPPEGY